MQPTRPADDISKVKWSQFLAGNEQAYSWLYTAYIQPLFAYGLHFTTDRELVKDCIQEIFTRIYKRKKTLPVPDNIKMFLFVSLKNCLFTALNRVRLYTGDADPEKFTFLATATVEEEFLQNETESIQQQKVRQLLSVLTPRQQEIIYYRFAEGLSFDEICELMNLNYQSAHNLIQRSLKKIRDTYGSLPFYLFLLGFPQSAGLFS